MPLAANRVSVRLEEKGDLLIVAQYVGERLPEGTKTLPSGSTFEYWIV
jgi:hypothetical protein